MIKKTYSLLDHTTGTFLNSLTFINDADAIRWFGTVVNNTDEKTNISEHPQQFTLYRLSDFNDQTGMYQSRDKEIKEITKDPITKTDEAPKQIITGNEVQLEATKTYTVKDLIGMLRTELIIE